MEWCQYLCVAVGAAGLAEGRDEASGLTLMKTMDPLPVRAFVATWHTLMIIMLFANTVFSCVEHFNSQSILALFHDFANLVADAWRALKSPSLGESSLEGAASGLSTTSPSEGLSVAPGGLADTPHFNTLAGGALGARTGKYSRCV